jgi:hypothetical protein
MVTGIWSIWEWADGMTLSAGDKDILLFFGEAHRSIPKHRAPNGAGPEKVFEKRNSA